MCATQRRLTFPPGFIPTTAVDSATGGLGPPAPENNPPAVSPSIFFAEVLMGSPATNWSGSATERFPPNSRADLEDTTSIPRNRQSKWTVTVVPGATSAPFPGMRS